MKTLNTFKIFLLLSSLTLLSCSRMQYNGENNLAGDRKLDVDCKTGDCDEEEENLSCSFNGSTVAHQQTITAYKDPQANPGGVCVSQERRCINGNLGGTFQYSSCQEEAPQDCTFNGQPLAHGSSVQAFQNSTVGYGAECVSQIRTCNDGALSGSYQYGTCSVGGPAACMFNGQTIQSGSSVVAYQNSTVAVGGVCAGETRSCENGVLSGSYSYASCAVDAPASCMFNNQTIPSGSSVVAYQAATVGQGEACVFQTRSCVNGVLSGSYVAASCTVGGGASCQFNGQTIAHGEFFNAFQASSASYPNECEYEARQCWNGQLTGTYAYSSCVDNGPRSCHLGGRTIAHGEKVIAYKECVANQGHQCEAQERTCDDGHLSGSFTHLSCDQGEARWVNVRSPSESYAAACSRAGGEPMASNQGLGKGVCAATESRPGPGSGEGWEQISYPYGIKNRHGRIYPQNIGGVVIKSSRSQYYCYKSGQKHDYDKTDRVAAYLCWFR